MGRLGDGYGSEFHLQRMLTADRARLEHAILREVGDVGTVEWLPFASRGDGQREWRGMEFLPDHAHRDAWKQFWPTKGNPPNWDAVGRLHLRETGTFEWLLVEAKARAGELESPACGAKGESRAQIETALDRTRRHYRIETDKSWSSTYYQIANRLASLYFLNEIARAPARMLFVYFTGDRFPDGSQCPATAAEWGPYLSRAQEALGLPEHLDRVHHVFISATQGAAVRVDRRAMNVDEVQICRGYTVRQWWALQPLLDRDDEDAWNIAIDVFERRIRERFITSIEALLHADSGRAADVDVPPNALPDGATLPISSAVVPGFAIVALCCLLIETLQSFVAAASRDTQEQFKAFLRRPEFGTAFADDAVAESFSRGVRNGIFHEGETRGWVLWREEPATGLVESIGRNRWRLNRTAFFRAIQREFVGYCAALKSPNPSLRSRFREQMRDMVNKC